ncbi:hypothetical protein B0O99DRAFT_692341 [Bisporella sp. PMI_857]|nr:hypothetical protein B0O99DRAFT_692341 [Bisporella sp. PMI_857]
MPLTGLMIRAMYGTRSRELLDNRNTPFDRLVVVTESLNSSQWWGFLGESNTVNSLLNKPHYHDAIIPDNGNKSLRMMLAFLIGSQWCLTVSACSVQGWNAYIVPSWILLCAVVSSHGYPLRSRVKDWLQHDCGIRIRHIVAEFSSQRSLLSTLVYLNPDSKESRMLWINPVLA